MVFSEVLETWLFLALFQVGFWLPQMGFGIVVYFSTKILHICTCVEDATWFSMSINWIQAVPRLWISEYLPYEGHRNVHVLGTTQLLGSAQLGASAIANDLCNGCTNLMSLPRCLPVLLAYPTILTLVTYLLIFASASVPFLIICLNLHICKHLSPFL